tara:strand:- start:240 stop:548 length:309 start_codon:yes stop_codon:yes gene_type:complete
MTNNIDKLAEEIFEANDDLPQSVNSNTTIWIGVVETGSHLGAKPTYKPVVGFSEDDLYRKSLGRGRLVWTDYYDNAGDILEDSVQDLWDYAYDRAEKRSVKQ